MTQPPGGYPPPEPGEQPPAGPPPAADPFYAPPSWEPPTAPGPPSQPPFSGPPHSGPPHSGPPSSGPPHYGAPPPPFSGPPYGNPSQSGPSSGPPSQPPYGNPPPSGAPTQPIPAVPSYPPGGGSYGPPGDPTYGPPGPPYPPAGPTQQFSRPPGPPRRRGPLIVAIVVAGALLVVGGGGIAAWLLARDPDRDGPSSPVAAVQSFLQAVYHDQDPGGAADLVCSEARDEAALETKIDEIRSYQQTQVNPTFSWSEPTVIEQGEELAVVAVTVTMVTGDEKVADQNLQVSVLDKDANGWWVCDLQTVDTTSEPPAEDPASGGTPTPTPTG